MSMVCNGTSSDLNYSYFQIFGAWIGVFLLFFVVMLILFVTAKDICDFLPAHEIHFYVFVTK